jgi:hypothetical protein
MSASVHSIGSATRVRYDRCRCHHDASRADWTVRPSARKPSGRLEHAGSHS